MSFLLGKSLSLFSRSFSFFCLKSLLLSHLSGIFSSLLGSLGFQSLLFSFFFGFECYSSSFVSFSLFTSGVFFCDSEFVGSLS